MKKVRHWWRLETRFHSHQAVVGVVVSVHSLLILVDWREERCWKTIPTSNRLYCQSVCGLNEECKALVAIGYEISDCLVGSEMCIRDRSVGGSNEESKALVAI